MLVIPSTKYKEYSLGKSQYRYLSIVFHIQKVSIQKTENKKISDAHLMSLMSSPCAATSVATRIGALPHRNWFRAWSRSSWDLSPWMEAAQNVRPIPWASWSHCLVVEQKMMILVPLSWLLRIWSSRRCLSSGGTTSTCCSPHTTQFHQQGMRH